MLNKKDIVVVIDGGVVCDVTIPKDSDIRVVIKDYDVEEKSKHTKTDKTGTYNEVSYESE